MKNLIITSFVALLIGGISSYSTLSLLYSFNVNGAVLSESDETTISPTNTTTPTLTETPAPTPTPKPTVTNTPTPTIILTPTPSPIPVPQFTSEQINGFIESFAGQYAVDPNVLRHIAVCESGFNPNATNLSYAGLYQFGVTAWMKYRQEIGEDTDPSLRLNAEEAVQTAAYILGTNRAYIWPNCVP